jgi:NAD(P)-dependent dehydrogenase (short-subunit alcohol dehydrogenase family)
MDWLGLKDAVCVVTGAAGGIGYGIAEGLAAAGAKVAVLDMNEQGAKQAAQNLAARSQVATLGLGADITRPEQLHAVAQTVKDTLGPCDVLVNNAGILSPAHLLDVTPEQWNKVMNVDLNGLLWCSQVFGREMAARKRGAIVNIASISGHFPQPWSGAYSAAKSAVIMLPRQLAQELGPEGVRCNAVCPGMIKTPMTEAFYADPAVERGRVNMTASRRIGLPEDVANVVVFLASPRAGYLNGESVLVDGGLSSMIMALTPRPGFTQG